VRWQNTCEGMNKQVGDTLRHWHTFHITALHTARKGEAHPVTCHEGTGGGGGEQKCSITPF
jgi:hypothetical protein